MGLGINMRKTFLKLNENTSKTIKSRVVSVGDNYEHAPFKTSTTNALVRVPDAEVK